MAETLADLGLTEFDDTRKDNFLTMMSDSLRNEQSAAMLGAPLGIPVIPFPPGTGQMLGDSFYVPGEDTPASHEERAPDFHEVAFGMMNTIGTTLNAPAAKSLTPFIDPTEPILQIINKIKDIIPEEEIIEKLEVIMAIAPKVIEAFEALPDVDLLAEILVEIKPELDLDVTIGTLGDLDLSVDLSGIAPPDIPIPTLPYLDVPQMWLPEIGLMAFFQALIQAAIDAVASIVATIIDAIDAFLTALMNGIQALVEYLISLIVDLIIDPIMNAFEKLAESAGFVALLSTIIVYTIGMVLLTIVGILIGTGLIAKGIQNLLGL
jgi:hypothetical protein